MRTYLMLCSVFFGSLALMVIGMPLLLIDGRDKKLYWHYTNLWASLWLWAGGVKLRIENVQHLNRNFGKSFFLLGNHESSLDVPIMLVICRGRLRMGGEKSLYNTPVLRHWIKRGGHTAIDRKNPRNNLASFDLMVERLKEGKVPQGVFAEGTRWKVGKVGTYKKGLFQLAKRAGVQVIPFCLIDSAVAMPPGSWRVNGGEVTIKISEPIPAEEVNELTRDELLAKTRAYALQFLPDAFADENNSDEQEEAA